MFTGLIEGVGTVRATRPDGEGLSIEVDLGWLAGDLAVGASVALSGVCCTVTHLGGPAGARFWLSPETLSRTWFGHPEHGLGPGRKVNLERSLRAGQPMGGHIVQGHVDGVGRVCRPVASAGGTWEVEVPERLLRYCVEKGSIALDGVSLTIAGMAGPRLSFAIIPHTASHTTVGASRAGEPVHVEVDILAKYVERLLAQRG